MTKQRIASSLILVGQLLVIFGIVYSAWHLGGVTTASLHYVSIGSLAVLIIASAVLLLRGQSKPTSLALPAIACLFLGYAVLQGSFGLGKQVEQFATPTVTAINQAIADLGEGTPEADSITASSTLGHRTQAALVPLASGIAFLIGASVFFVDKRSRVVFAAAVIGNAMSLVCWGFIQRAGENEFILPGMLHEVDSVPFASFIYKNAGAAALLPALAIAAVALLKGRTFEWNSPVTGSPKTRSSYGSASSFFELSNLVLISTALFLSAGLVISLCRGAWLAVLLAFAVAFALDRRLKLTRASLSLGVIGSVVVVTLLFILGGNEIARARAGDVSIDRLAADQRWSHWPDGWDTAVAHFPMGSGLGTYRYATLPYQRSVHKNWFQNAHNQYLETFTETGVVGIALLTVGIFWLASHCLGLIRHGEDSSSRRWGLIALIVLVCGCVQSAIDFVLIIPANLYLYAAVFGVAISCARRPPDPAAARSRIWDWNPGWKLSTATIGASILFVVASVDFCSNQRFANQVMAQTQASNLDAQPSLSQMDDAIAKLDEAIDRLPSSPQLRSGRAAWEVTRMRAAIINLARDSGEPISWETTDSRRLFTALQLATPQQRSALTRDLRTSPDIRQHLVAALKDLRDATILEPCIPQNHINSAFLSPLAQMPANSFLPTIAKLSNNSHHLLYNGGLIAYMTDQSDLAVELWHRCLDIRLQHIEPIYQLSTQRFAPEVLVRRIIPSRRMDLAIRMIGNIPFDEQERRAHVASEIVTAIGERDDLETPVRWSWIAKIHESVRNYDEASVAWRKAVASGGRNLDYRYSLALSLKRIGKTEEAIDQALLGSAIASDDDRFDRLIGQCRRELGRRELTRKPQQTRPAAHAATRPIETNHISTRVSL